MSFHSFYTFRKKYTLRSSEGTMHVHRAWLHGPSPSFVALITKVQFHLMESVFRLDPNQSPSRGTKPPIKPLQLSKPLSVSSLHNGSHETHRAVMRPTCCQRRVGMWYQLPSMYCSNSAVVATFYSITQTCSCAKIYIRRPPYAGM